LRLVCRHSSQLGTRDMLWRMHRALIPGSVKSVSGEDRYIATLAIPIGGLPPGDYVIRVTVTVPGQPSGRLVRTLRKQ
jgi:hypothetical protein